jgi:hypothetical protein
MRTYQSGVILNVAVLQARGPQRQVFVAGVEKEGRTRFCFVSGHDANAHSGRRVITISMYTIN